MNPIFVRKHPRVEKFYQKCSDIEHAYNPITIYKDNYQPALEVAYPDIFGFLNGHIKPLQPDILVINQGHWPCPSIRSEPGLTMFTSAIQNATPSGGIALWKSTTAKGLKADSFANSTEFMRALQNGVDSTEFKRTLQNRGIHVFDAWEIRRHLSLRPEAYWDQLHFNPFVYRELNIALLNYLQNSLAK
jgi:hypothetical protein